MNGVMIEDWRRFKRVVVVTLIPTLFAMAALILLRRAVGASISSPSFAPSLAAGLIIAAATYAIRNNSRLPPVMTSIVAWLWVLALTGTSPLAVLALWLPLVAVEVVAWKELQGSRGEGVRAREEPAAVSPSPPLPLTPAAIHQEEPASENILQQLTRSRTDDGETITGFIRIDFAAQEQTAVAHLAFSPPLASEPAIEVESGDENFTVKIGESRSYGARLEAKRSGPCENAASVLVEFAASSHST